MPRVADNQRNKFDSEEFFQKFTKDGEIRYAWPKDRQSAEDRLNRLQADCREGHLHIAFTGCGTNIPLRFPVPEEGVPPSKEYVDFDRETGKVHFTSRVILNGVCVRILGVLDLTRFEGMARLEYDDENAQREEKRAREMVDLMPVPMPSAHFQPQEPGQPMWSEGHTPVDTKPVMGTYVHQVPLHNN